MSKMDFPTLKLVPEDIEDDRIWHVYPQFGRQHATESRGQCWCQPRIEFEGDGAIIIHEAEQ